MISIFSDMVEHYLEVFMDDFSMFGDSFDECLSNLQKVLIGVKKKFTTKLGKVSFHGHKRDCIRRHCFFKRH